MIEFFKKLFGVKPAEVKVPYKVETPVAPTLSPKAEEKSATKKKPAVKKATTRKPKTPKA
jgi:hypothetical protein